MHFLLYHQYGFAINLGKQSKFQKEWKNANALTVFLSGKQDSVDGLVNLISIPNNEWNTCWNDTWEKWMQNVHWILMLGEAESETKGLCWGKKKKKRSSKNPQGSWQSTEQNLCSVLRAMIRRNVCSPFKRDD